MIKDPNPHETGGERGDASTGTNGKTDRGLMGFVRRNRPLVTHWVLFVGVLGLMVAVAEVAADWVNVRFAKATANAMAWLLTSMGFDSHVEGVRVINNVCRFRIIGECTAYFPCAIYASAVLAYPSPWRGRVAGILLGIPAVLAVNQVRLLTLCYIFHNYEEYFDTAHYVVWQSLIIFFTVFIWILWVTLVARRS